MKILISSMNQDILNLYQINKASTLRDGTQ